LIVTSVENTSFTLEWPTYDDRQHPGNEVQYNVYVYDETNATINRNEIPKAFWIKRANPLITIHTTDTSHKFTGLRTGNLYEYTITAQNNASQTSMVGSSRVKMGNHAPSLPELINPTAETTGVATDTSLSWTESVDPDGDEVTYYIYLDTINHTNKSITVEGIDTTSYNPEGLREGCTYYWYVIAKDCYDGAVKSQMQTFCTAADGMYQATSPSPTPSI
jgi:hypothetical protein